MKTILNEVSAGLFLVCEFFSNGSECCMHFLHPIHYYVTEMTDPPCSIHPTLISIFNS